VATHSAQSSQGIEWELDKSYLLRRGMYAYSRNPMYLSEMILILVRMANFLWEHSSFDRFDGLVPVFQLL
jgi:hypothetical protein